VTADVSFISLRLVLPALARCAPDAEWLLLVKPQFEVGPENVGKGGVVRDDALRAQAVEAVAREASALGFAEIGRSESRVAGPAGNREIFVWLRPRRDPAASGESSPRPIGDER
jgi:23S rRNA (cytidine1920-2'-O)/16S rRNA (cytidine1409-2'-O)-methyltransferase